MEEAARPGGSLAHGGSHALTVPQAFSLRHGGDLLEDLPEADVQEMRDTVLEILSSIAGENFSHKGISSSGNFIEEIRHAQGCHVAVCSNTLHT